MKQLPFSTKLRKIDGKGLKRVCFYMLHEVSMEMSEKMASFEFFKDSSLSKFKRM
jgi:hypothetical protein